MRVENENLGIAIVTGVSKGLGLALKHELLKAGYKVLGISRSAGENHCNFVHLRGDLTHPEFHKTIVNMAQKMGTIKCLVNCAGNATFSKIGGHRDTDIESMISLNLTSAIKLTNLVLQLFDDGGDIVNVISTAALSVRTDQAVYSATKYGMKGFSLCLAEELSHSKVRLTTVYPGGMQTNFWKGKQIAQSQYLLFLDPDYVARLIVNNLICPNDTWQAELIIARDRPQNT